MEAIDPKALERAKKLNTTVIFDGIHIVGDVQGSHNYYLNGALEGTIELSALLIIGKSGVFKGEAKAENVIIEGEFEGNLTAKERVEIRDEGKFVGDILAPAVLVSDKAFFQGNVTMDRGTNNAADQHVRSTQKAPQDNVKKMAISE